MAKLNFPGHNYLGPGNPIINGEPVDRDDEIAAIHDYFYENAETREDIFEADKMAMDAFLTDAKNNRNWHSMVGLVGLCIKHAIEKIVGRSLYPFNLPKENKNSINKNDIKCPLCLLEIENNSIESNEENDENLEPRNESIENCCH